VTGMAVVVDFLVEVEAGFVVVVADLAVVGAVVVGLTVVLVFVEVDVLDVGFVVAVDVDA
jgi:hypothetical protein